MYFEFKIVNKLFCKDKYKIDISLMYNSQNKPSAHSNCKPSEQLIFSSHIAVFSRRVIFTLQKEKLVYNCVISTVNLCTCHIGLNYYT